MDVKKILKDSRNHKELGEVMVSKSLTRVRPDGVMMPILIEIGHPEEHPMSKGGALWVCRFQVTGVGGIHTALATSSLDAVVFATYRASALLQAMPYASEINLNIMPNFGLPVCPMNTTPERLSEMQRGKHLGRKG